MKAERKQPEFEPVIITLESEDELNYLWHCLNMPQIIVEKNHRDDVLYSYFFDKHSMWETLDKIVRPEKY